METQFKWEKVILYRETGPQNSLLACLLHIMFVALRWNPGHSFCPWLARECRKTNMRFHQIEILLGFN